VDLAQHYLAELEKRAQTSWAENAGDSIPKIALDDCYPGGTQGTPFENIFHKRNLQSIVERRLFQ